MKEFIVYDKETGIDGEKCIKKHPWLFKFPNIRVERTCNTKWNYLPFKTVVIMQLDVIEDLTEIMAVSPTVSFNFNNLGFPRIELD